MSNNNFNIHMPLDELLVSMHRTGMNHVQRFDALKTSEMGRESLKSLTLTLLSNVSESEEDRDFWLFIFGFCLSLRTGTLAQAGRLDETEESTAASHTEPA